jgi:hypothetical protein
LKLELQEVTENSEVIEHLEQEYSQAQANLNQACQQLVGN